MGVCVVWGSVMCVMCMGMCVVGESNVRRCVLYKICWYSEDFHLSARKDVTVYVVAVIPPLQRT